MLQRKKKFYTPAEYLALEETADYKSEYYQGEIFAMAGASFNHNLIASNLITLLNQQIPSRSCFVLPGDIRLLVKKNGLYTYPDVIVVCDQPKFDQGRTDTITNPLLITEILSETTQAYDRAGKFELYRALESLQEYVLVDQARVYIEYFRKSEDGTWQLKTYDSMDETLKLLILDVELPIKEIYNRIVFE